MMRRVLAAIALLALTSAPALADGDAAKGATVFKKCMACHEATKVQNKTGPHLVGLIGRAAASVEGYAYSPAMKAYAAKIGTWDEEKLDVYLADSRGQVPGTKMALAPLKKEDEREDLIAYLKSLPAPAAQ